MKVFYCSTRFECYYTHPQELANICGCVALFRCVLVYWCGSAGVGWYPNAGWGTYSTKEAHVCCKVQFLYQYKNLRKIKTILPQGSW